MSQIKRKNIVELISWDIEKYIKKENDNEEIIQAIHITFAAIISSSLWWR
jgi:hypothetical protein